MFGISFVKSAFLYLRSKFTSYGLLTPVASFLSPSIFADVPNPDVCVGGNKAFAMSLNNPPP